MEAVTTNDVFFMLKCFSCLSVSLCIVTEQRYWPVERRLFFYVHRFLTLTAISDREIPRQTWKQLRGHLLQDAF